MGKIFVPVDENNLCQYDNLTRFLTEEEIGEVSYIYGFLMEKMNRESPGK